ncbi:hypothetical protein PGT21_015391 [Puccinia graminis f. sp. tritici]|uniref:Secreted protein n=1 Tax=Puccinia graminis f. sp. tritici TaxID=56615 RepID=A0A5B0N0X1_PUCGR|nr:hypothetical protein PGT21_015391 [Puccinia graminis f. sp. tritici]KAA1087970.1 hypothetical protein PGTUg99_011790 [Puccinia graminis f. sp. tritici]
MLRVQLLSVLLLCSSFHLGRAPGANSNYSALCRHTEQRCHGAIVQCDVTVRCNRGGDHGICGTGRDASIKICTMCGQETRTYQNPRCPRRHNIARCNINHDDD